MKRLGLLGTAIRGPLVQLPALTGLGVVGLTLGAMCVAGAIARGVEVPPEGNLLETATFDGALGLFILTLAVLAPGVEWTRRGRRIWVRLLVGFTLYAYAIETTQAFRGLDPRFSRVAGPLDQAAGGIFFLTALGIMCCFLVPLIFDFFKKSLVIWGHRGLERCAVRTASPSRGSRRLFSST